MPNDTVAKQPKPKQYWGIRNGTAQRNRYSAHKMRERGREATLADQCIPDDCLAAPKNPRRRKRACENLLVHAKTYHGDVFCDPWASYHEELGGILQETVLSGGWHAMAVPRGGGKTQLCQICAEWAILHGHKMWPILFGATDPLAEAAIKNFLFRIRFNELLREDFPEVCIVFQNISAHNARTRRSPSGVELGCIMGADKVVMPCYADEVNAAIKRRRAKLYGHGATGSRVSSFGLTGAFRGLSDATVAGQVIRPDFCICDDPQTRLSARSFAQSKARMDTIVGDIAYLSGPNTKMSVVVPLTVIYKRDMGEQLLDRNLNPEWHGRKVPFFYSMPKNMTLWNQYYEIKCRLMRADEPLDEANQFYKKNMNAMHEGAEVSWQHRLGGMMTAVQNGMDRYLANRPAFMAEFQNNPDSDQDDLVAVCPPEEIVRKQAHTVRHVLPKYVEELVAHIDVQQESIWYTIAGGSKQFEVAVPDYGTFPQQGREYFTKTDILHTLSTRYKTETKLDKRIYMGLREVLDDLSTREFAREDGVHMKIGLILVDCGYEQSLVAKACREAPCASILLPSKGLSVKAVQKQFAEINRKEGETKGHHWVVKPISGDRICLMDVNYWKSQVHQMFIANPGPGALRLFQSHFDGHRMLADHCNAEYCVRVSAKGQEVDEWFEHPGQPDNERLDNLVGCLVALSIRGCRISEIHDDQQKDQPEPTPLARRVSKRRWENRRRMMEAAREEAEKNEIGEYMG